MHVCLPGRSLNFTSGRLSLSLMYQEVDPMNLNAILDIVTVAALGFISFLLTVGKGAVEGWVKTSAEKGAETAIYNLNWPQKLAQELEQTRGVERQEIRFQSYGALWANLRPLAIYDSSVVDAATIEKLSKALSDWYFSESGGLLLSAPVRDFYFALQDLLRAITRDGHNWKADRSSDDPRRLFREILQREELAGAITTLEKLEALDIRDWPKVAVALGQMWRKDIPKLATRWSSLGPDERFAVLQQVGSTLRTSMTNDVESRLR
jgi:hypothetical protein